MSGTIKNVVEAEIEHLLADRLDFDAMVAELPPTEEIDALPDIVFVIDDHGTILNCHGGDPADLTRPREELIGKRVTRCPFEDVGARFESALSEARLTGEAVSIEYALPCGGRNASFDARLQRHRDGRVLAVVRNTTRKAQAESAMRAREQEYRNLLNSAHVAIMLVDPSSGEILECNPSARTLYRVDDAGLVGAQLASLFIDPNHVPDLPAIVEDGESTKIESWHRTQDESVIMAETVLSRVVFRKRQLLLAVIRELQMANGEGPEMRNMLSMLQATFDATADGILVVDPNANVVTFNRILVEMSGIPDELLKPGNEQTAFKLALAKVEDPKATYEEVVRIHNSTQARSSGVVRLVDGRCFECVSMPQLIGGVNVGRVWSVRDITDRAQTEERIRHHAYHDSLTGLPNRALFQDRLAQELGQARRSGTNTALLLIDLDRFKTINDTLGHAAGDQLLVEVAKRFKSRTREGDTIARLGGDEFVFIISKLRHREDAAVVADQVLDVLKEQIHVADYDLHVSASIGIAIFPEDGEEGTSLMKSADVALYRAKELGRNTYQMFEPKLNERAMERLVLEKDLRRAIHEREFVLHYQPQYELKTGEIRGVEALVRWQQGDAMVPPAKFIPIAEECGLVVPLGRWVLEEAARRCAQFSRITGKPLRICVNVSALQIQRPDFANEVSRILQANDLPIQQLVVELTESALMQNPEQGSWAMEQLKQMGIGLAMDDFGTGHSSLHHLSWLPISMIKIDRSFVINCTKRKADAAILEAIIKMGHALDLKVLAEGVDHEDQLAVLRQHGCDEVQGYLYSRPVAAEQLIEMLGKGKP